MSSTTIFIALATLIVGVAKAFSYWNGRKTERLKNAENQVKKDEEAKTTSNCVTSDSKFRNGVRDFFSDE